MVAATAPARAPWACKGTSARARPSGPAAPARPGAPDLRAVARLAPWARRHPDLLAREVAEMAVFFPAWQLTAGDGAAPCRCAACGDLLAFRDGGLRCDRCGSAGPTGRPLWLGHLSALVGGLPRAAARIRGAGQAAYPLATLGRAPIWRVPVLACYPVDWPRRPPVLRYDPALFSILGLGRPDAALRLTPDGAAILYGPDEWRPTPLRTVLQERALPHLAGLLQVADGRPPAEAFAALPPLGD